MMLCRPEDHDSDAVEEHKIEHKKKVASTFKGKILGKLFLSKTALVQKDYSVNTRFAEGDILTALEENCAENEDEKDEYQEEQDGILRVKGVNLKSNSLLNKGYNQKE